MSTTIQAHPETGDGPAPVTGRLASLARVLVDRRRIAMLLVGLIAVAAALVGASVESKLSSGGYTPDSAESIKADRLLAGQFHAGAPNLVLVVRADGDVGDGEAAAAGRELTGKVAATPGVVYAQSYWSAQDPTLRSADGRTALVLVKLGGDESQSYHLARDLVPTLVGRHGPLDVKATGSAQVNSEADEQSALDLKKAEVLAAPLTLIILLATFGSLVAASLPALVGVVSVVGTYAVLRVLTEATSVSVFALNITTALGFGLAVDYSLFIVTRYREELDAGRTVTEAVAASLRSAGRTVLFSALTVVLSLSALLVFPIYFLRSLAYAGIVVVVIAAASSVLVLPPLLALIGHRIDRFDVFAPVRRRLPGSRTGNGLWHRLAHTVMRRPVLIGGGVALLLAALVLPFTQARFALMDDRVLPRGSASQVASDTVRAEFHGAQTSPVVVVAPALDPAVRQAELTDYAQRLSAIPHTQRVDSAVGTFAGGNLAAPAGPASAAFAAGGGSWLSVVSDVDPGSSAGEAYARAVRALPAPADVLVGGDAATQVDTKAMLSGRLPWAGAIIAVSMLVLLFLFSGSVIIPLKQLILNMLSLTASFGAMVYVFQDGHLKWLVGDFVHTGQLEVTVPILMFCVAFGLSMDYSVFLLSRIREEYLATGDNTRAVAFGMERTGRLITAAALIVATVLGALATSELSILKLLGAGLALAVLIDATLVRGLLVPAAMRLLGEANWWAPAPLRRLHARFGLTED